MTEAQFNSMLGVGVWICVAGSVLNLILFKKRGTSALLLAGAFLLMAGVLWLMKSQASQALVGVAGTAVAVLLISDFVLRFRKQGRQP